MCEDKAISHRGIHHGRPAFLPDQQHDMSKRQRRFEQDQETVNEETKVGMDDLERNSMTKTMKQEAINYAKRGWPIFPVHTVMAGSCSCGNADCSSPGKHPMTQNGCKDATTDQRQVEQWWSASPKANIGIRTGKESGVFVLDIDPDHGGAESLAGLCEEFSKLPETWTAETGGGGRHYYFQYPDEELRNRNSLRPGVDIRGEGGYVVAAPSNHIKGCYRWKEGYGPDEIAIVPAPKWLLDVIQRRDQQSESSSDRSSIVSTKSIPGNLRRRLQDYMEKADGLGEGQRNEKAFFCACRLREIAEDAEYGLSTEELVSLLQPWNDRNTPPLAEPELRKICESSTKRQLRGVSNAGENESSKSTGDSAATKLVSSDAMLAYKEFPIDALPEPIASYVKLAAESIGCDPSFVALPLLTAIAAAIGNSRRIQLKEGWKEPPILWTAIVGDSGTTKSPAMGVATTPLDELQNRAYADYKKKLKEFKQAEKIYKQKLKEWEKNKSDSLLPPEEPEPPVMPHYYCEDATIEALIMVLQETPRGTLVVRDELVGWMGSFDRYTSASGGDVAHWLKIFGGRQLKVDRKSSLIKTIVVPYASVCVTGGIQPLVLKDSLTKNYRENGLAARLLFAMPPRKAKKWTDKGVPADAAAQMTSLLESLYSLKMLQSEDETAKPKVVTLAPESLKTYVEFFNLHNERQLELSGDMGAAWSKLEGYAARLALVIHCVKSVQTGATDDEHEQVDLDSMQSALKLIDWFGYEAQRVYGRLILSAEEERFRDIVDWIRRRGGSVKVRDLQRGRREFKTSEEAELVLRQLVAAGICHRRHQKSEGDGGRATDWFVLIDHMTKAASSHEPAKATTYQGEQSLAV